MIGDEDLKSWEMVGNKLISKVWEPCIYSMPSCIIEQEMNHFVFFICYVMVVMRGKLNRFPLACA